MINSIILPSPDELLKSEPETEMKSEETELQDSEEEESETEMELEETKTPLLPATLSDSGHHTNSNEETVTEENTSNMQLEMDTMETEAIEQVEEQISEVENVESISEMKVNSNADSDSESEDYETDSATGSEAESEADIKVEIQNLQPPSDEMQAIIAEFTRAADNIPAATIEEFRRSQAPLENIEYRCVHRETKKIIYVGVIPGRGQDDMRRVIQAGNMNLMLTVEFFGLHVYRTNLGPHSYEAKLVMKPQALKNLFRKSDVANLAQIVYKLLHNKHINLSLYHALAMYKKDNTFS